MTDTEGVGAIATAGSRITPRQEAILELAAAGLSDKEIARRLSVTHRTVRTHFERLYSSSGKHSSSAAVAAWLTHRQAAPARPADECPHPRPFPEAFAGCPAYEPAEVVSLDLSYRPLACFRTCRHLRRQPQSGSSAWYGACALGDETDRAEWARAAGPERLSRLERLREGLARALGPDLEQLVRLKRRQLAAFARGAPVEAETHLLQQGALRLLALVDEVLEEEQALLAEIQLPMEACRELMRHTIDSLVQSSTLDFQASVPETVIERLPADVRLLFQPSLARTSIAPPLISPA